MASKDEKKGGGGFFSSIASSLSNFGTAMHKSVNGYGEFSAIGVFELISRNSSFFFSMLVFAIGALAFLCV